jgi:hypothetical protein
MWFSYFYMISGRNRVVVSTLAVMMLRTFTPQDGLPPG